MLGRILDQEATSFKGYGTKFLMLVTWGVLRAAVFSALRHHSHGGLACKH